jgi:glycosyltransferase involved in cell wall biosynthesis
MRFVFLTLGYHPDIDGGAFRYAAEVAEVLAARGHEVHAVAKNPSNKLAPEEVRNGVRLHRLSEPGGGGFRANWAGVNRAAATCLDDLLRNPAPTLLASHHAYFEPALRGRRFITFFHGPWGLEHRFACEGRPRSVLHRLRDAMAVRFLHRTEARALRGSQHLLVTSRYIEGRLKEWHPGVRVPIQVVGGGANHARFNEGLDRQAIRQSRGIAPNDFVFLAVRRLDPRMGLLVLVEAFAQAARLHPRARLWIAGKGVQQAQLQARMDALGLHERARLLGFVPEADLPGLYAAADAVVMPSLDLEGFGLVTAEALACGTPVLASRAGANAEVVGPLNEELLFTAGSIDALGQKIGDVLAGRWTLPIRPVCAAYARRAFRWDRAADGFEQAHRRLSGGNP